MPRVVVISPSSLVRFRLQRELSPRGFIVIDVADAGAGAARAIRDAAADVVLIDGGCATATGRILVKHLKQDPAIRRTPVLFLDDRDPGEEARRQVLHDGADGIVPRGDDFDALAATLTLHLRR